LVFSEHCPIIGRNMDQLDSEQLLKWLIRHLEPICSEEPDVLAQYVEALIKDDDMSRQDLQKHCISELIDFLNEETENFVEKLFAAIDDGSYLQDTPAIDDKTNNLDVSIQEDSPPRNDRRDSTASAFDNEDDDEEENENYRRRKYEDSGDEGSKRQRRDDSQQMRQNNDRDRHQGNMPMRNMGDGKGGGMGGKGGKGGGRNQPNQHFNHRGPMNMPPMHGGGKGESFGMHGRMPMGRGGGMWEGDQGRGGFPSFGPGAPPGPGMWNMNMGGGGDNMMFPPHHDQFGGPPGPPRPPFPPPPPGGGGFSGGGMHGIDEGNYHFQPGFNDFPQGNPPQPMGAPPPGPPKHHQFSGRGHASAGPDEQFTVKCSGIPQYVKEIDLYKHFATFGTIIKLALFRLGGPDEDSGSKVYNEAMVQFEEVADAKKCLGSPQSVLDNRFIKLFGSKENLIPPMNVAEYLQSEDAEVYPGFRDDEQQLKASGGKGGKGGKGGGKGGKGGGRLGGKGGRFGGRGGQEKAAGGEDEPIDEEAALLLKEQQKQAAKAKREEIKEMREVEAKHQYEELKQLRHQADSITRKKEELLQSQIDQFRGMMSKVEKIGSDEAEKARMIESLESKVMSLQASLQALRNGQSSISEMDGSPAGKGSYRGGGGYKGGGGRGYKGGGYKGGGRGGRGGYKGAGGKGYYGRGDGGRGERSLDNRSKALLVSGAPADFLGNAHLHFSKFGEVVQTSKLNEGDSTESPQFVVEFSNVHGAESALRGGLNFNNTTLTAEYRTKKQRTDSVGSNPATSSQDGTADS